MSSRSPTYKAILKEVSRGSDRSTLFWWFVEHHDQLLEEADGRRLRWVPLCARLADHGLADVYGRPATPRTARETWLQARKVVAEARSRKEIVDAKKRPGDKYPSRISPDWRPEIVSQPPPSAARPGSALAPAVRPAWSPPAAAPNVRISNPSSVAEPEIIRDANGVPYDEASQVKLREMRARLFGQLEKSDRGKFGP